MAISFFGRRPSSPATSPYPQGTTGKGITCIGRWARDRSAWRLARGFGTLARRPDRARTPAGPPAHRAEGRAFASGRHATPGDRPRTVGAGRAGRKAHQPGKRSAHPPGIITPEHPEHCCQPAGARRRPGSPPAPASRPPATTRAGRPAPTTPWAATLEFGQLLHGPRTHYKDLTKLLTL